MPHELPLVALPVDDATSDFLQISLPPASKQL
jgi:hypothetical protein